MFWNKKSPPSGSRNDAADRCRVRPQLTIEDRGLRLILVPAVQYAGGSSSATHSLRRRERRDTERTARNALKNGGRQGQIPRAPVRPTSLQSPVPLCPKHAGTGGKLRE